MRRIIRSLLCTALLLIWVSGCGDSKVQVSSNGGEANDSESPSAPAAPEAPSAPGTPSAPVEDPMAATPGEPAMDPMATANPGLPEATDPMGSQTQAKPALSDNVAEWQPDDFRNAARTGDRRLKPAIESLVGRTPGDEQTAELLVELLTLLGESGSSTEAGGAEMPPGMPPTSPPATPAPAAPGVAPAAFSPSTDPNIMFVSFQAEVDPEAAAAPPGGPLPMPGTGANGQPQIGGRAGLVHDVINGLARNGSPRAWQGLTQLLAGEIKTGVSDDEIADWVISAALDNYGGSGHPTHAFLDQALKNPQSLNVSRGEELRRQAEGIFAGTAAAILDHLMGVPNGGEPPQHSRPGEQAASPEAIPMSSPMPMPAAAPGLQAGGAPGGQLPQPGPFRLHKRPMTDEGVRNAIQYLWQADTLNYLQLNTLGMTRLSNGVGTLALAGSLPTSGMRKATFDLLNGRWEEGADPLITAGLYQSVARDPGLIVVLKRMPRIMPTGQQQNQQNYNANPRASKSQRESAAKQDWMQLSAMMVRSVTERLKASTQNSSVVTSVPSLPIKLHRDAEVRGVRTLNWPEDIASASADGATPGSLSLQYVLMDAPADVPRVFEFYKKQLKRGKDYKFPTGAWIDSITVGSQAGTRRSVDVLITQNQAANNGGTGGPADPGAAAGNPGAVPMAGGVNQPIGGQQQLGPQYTIEILIVETEDPKTPGKR